VFANSHITHPLSIGGFRKIVFLIVIKMIIGFARLNINAPLIENIGSLNDLWYPHFNKDGYEGDWNVLTLRSPGGNADNIFAELNGQNYYADTIQMKNFPSVKKLIDELKCEVMSVRFLNLKAGAVIKQHRDHELAFEKGEARLHFPITTNNEVEFYVNDLRVVMLPGECWYINANMPHRVANYGDTDRIHLVIDCKVNEWIKAIFESSEKTTFAAPDNTNETLQVIETLRRHQTETASKLADELEHGLRQKKLLE